MTTERAPAGRRMDPGRRENLSRVLRAVHATPRPRSELTRLTGLNRSTVAALVAELAERGLVVEDDPSILGVGRPSPTVRPADRAVAFAVHPEIDAVRVAAVRLGGRVVRTIRVDVAERPDAASVVAIAREAVAELRADLPSDAVVVGAGVAVPGLVRFGDGMVRLAPHLDWHDVPIAAMLEDALGVPVSAANEASLGAAAEWTFGAGRGVADLLYVNGGASGIGGGIVVGGSPLRGAGGHAGEVGHVVVGGSGHDSAGLAGTLESQVTRDRLAAALGTRTADPDAFERALVADRSEAVRTEIGRQVRGLAVALASVVNVLGSERVVLGGFLGALVTAAPDELRREFDRHLLAPLVDEVELRRAELGADLLLIGAAALPFERVLAELPTLG